MQVNNKQGPPTYLIFQTSVIQQVFDSTTKLKWLAAGVHFRNLQTSKFSQELTGTHQFEIINRIDLNLLKIQGRKAYY